MVNSKISKKLMLLVVLNNEVMKNAGICSKYAKLFIVDGMRGKIGRKRPENR